MLRPPPLPSLDAIELPAALEFDKYRLYNPDLASFSDEALAEHYARFGEAEGRCANSLASRDDFAALVPAGADALEIGPFNHPLLRGTAVRYLDVLPRAGLVERAQAIGISTAGIPEITFVSENGDFSMIDKQFDFILSSHTIEHQPDLIGHLRNVERLLRDGGRYLVIVPDKRYCFDHFMAESTLADIVDAHHTRRTTHTLKSVIEHRALTTHNDSQRHWNNDHGLYMADSTSRTQAALAEYVSAAGAYIDVHAWFFTPASAQLIFRALKALDVTSLGIERLYPTRLGANEFWFVLQK